MSTIDGGQAFPGYEKNPGSSCDFYRPVPGITMRDYFAAKAMQAIVSIGDKWMSHADANYIAELAYAMADAMLKAREI